MINLSVVGAIIKKRAESIADDTITSSLKEEGYSDEQIQIALKAIEEDFVLEVKTIRILTPIAPVNYRFGVKKIEKDKNILFGLFHKITEVGLRTIDRVSIEKNILWGSLTVMHSGQSQVFIDKITRSDSELLKNFYCDVIEAQRKSVVNITED